MKTRRQDPAFESLKILIATCNNQEAASLKTLIESCLKKMTMPIKAQIQTVTESLRLHEIVSQFAFEVVLIDFDFSIDPAFLTNLERSMIEKKGFNKASSLYPVFIILFDPCKRSQESTSSQCITSETIQQRLKHLKRGYSINRRHLDESLLALILSTTWERFAHSMMLDKVIEATNEHSILAITDAEGTITFVNDRFCLVSGYERAELIGQNHRILSSGYHSREFFEEMWHQLKSGQVWHGEIKNRSKTGKCFWLQTTILPFQDENQKVTQFVTLRTDVTAIKEQYDMAIKNTLLESNFMANVTHEIRSPLQAILGITEVLELSSMPTEAETHVEVLKNSSRNLLNLVNDLLDFSKLKVKALQLETISFDTNKIAESSRSMFSQIADQKEIKFLVKSSKNMPQLVGDPTRITQIVVNLVGNAIKFTDSGFVSLMFFWLPCQNYREDLAEKRSGDLCIEVRDSGIGMSEATLSILFKPFTQADRSIARKYGGTGLGLSITKNLVDLMGGEIIVRSAENLGSTFKVLIPLSEADFSAESAFEKKTEKICGEIIIVEDDNATRLIISTLLQKMGFEIRTFSDGQSFLKFLHATKLSNAQRNIEKANQILAIFLDDHLPDTSGRELAIEIMNDVQNGQSSIDQNTRVIGLSGNDFGGSSLSASGYTHWLKKPASKLQILSCLADAEIHGSQSHQQDMNRT